MKNYIVNKINIFKTVLGFFLFYFFILFIFYIHMRPDLSYDGWPWTIPNKVSVGPMFVLDTWLYSSRSSGSIPCAKPLLLTYLHSLGI